MRLEVVVVPVSDVDRAKRFYASLKWRLDADLAGRGVDVSDPFHDVTGNFHHAGTEGRVSGPAPDHADDGSFAGFSDPDGHGPRGGRVAAAGHARHPLRQRRRSEQLGQPRHAADRPIWLREQFLEGVGETERGVTRVVQQVCELTDVPDSTS
jgi:catechol 2,3-dioxygenase-like lactoylglutathione lyase family enzyme